MQSSTGLIEFCKDNDGETKYPDIKDYPIPANLGISENFSSTASDDSNVRLSTTSDQDDTDAESSLRYELLFEKSVQLQNHE